MIDGFMLTCLGSHGSLQLNWQTNVLSEMVRIKRKMFTNCCKYLQTNWVKKWQFIMRFGEIMEWKRLKMTSEKKVFVV